MNFVKMAGCGNDFIVVDNRNGQVRDDAKGSLAKTLCRRRRSIGADGMIFIENSQVAHAKMDYFNADGSRGEMCGNGLRCFARLTALEGICPGEMQVETYAGIYQALVNDTGVQLAMPPVDLPQGDIQLEGLPVLDFLQVGVPHAVIFNQQSSAWSEDELCRLGWEIRRHPYFAAGTNVNFVAQGEKGLMVRTYERGVEAETLACGTGATASALAAAVKYGLPSPIPVQMPGGLLEVSFVLEKQGFTEVRLQGDAQIIARGQVSPEALI